MGVSRLERFDSFCFLFEELRSKIRKSITSASMSDVDGGKEGRVVEISKNVSIVCR